MVGCLRLRRVFVSRGSRERGIWLVGLEGVGRWSRKRKKSADVCGRGVVQLSRDTSF